MTEKPEDKQCDAATEPPDGAWGWIIVFAVFWIGCFTWGVYVAYPVFYQPLMDEFGINLGDVTWISGTHEIGRALGHLSMPFFSGDHNYRIPSIIVSLISAVSISFSGYVTSEFWVYLLLSFIPGFALGNLTVSTFVMIARYFDSKKYFALGLAQTGATIGTLSLAPLFQYFVDFYGLRGAILLVGGLSLNCIVASALLRPIRLISDEPKQPVSAVESGEANAFKTVIKLLKKPKFWAAVFALLCTFGGLRTYLAFLVPLGNTFADANHMKSSLVLSVFCGISLAAKVLIGAVGDIKKIDVILLLLILAVAAAFCMATVWFITSYTWLFVNCAFTSIATSTCHIMVVPLVAAAVGKANLQWGISLSGFTYTMIGAGIVPLTGYLIDLYGDVRLGYLIAASFMLLGSVLHIPLLLRKDASDASAPL